MAYDPSIQCFGISENPLFEPMCERAYFVLIKNYAPLYLLFLNFFDDFWLTNSHVPFRIDHPALL